MTHVFTASKYVRQELGEHFGVPPARVTAVGTGRGKVAPFHGDKDYSNGLMLFVGKGDFVDKGGDLAVEALKRARQVLPHLRLVVTCNKEYLPRLADVPGVEAHADVSWEQLQDFYNRATLFVMPARHQPWGLAFLEALSVRMPIVGLDRLSTPELTGSGRYGFALQGEDPEALAAVMVDAYRHPDRLAAMGAGGQKFCLDTFTWDKTVDRMLAAMGD